MEQLAEEQRVEKVIGREELRDQEAGVLEELHWTRRTLILPRSGNGIKKSDKELESKVFKN